MKNPGSTRRNTREKVGSEFKGWRKREEEGHTLYRSAAASILSRAKRKLTGKERKGRETSLILTRIRESKRRMRKLQEEEKSS